MINNYKSLTLRYLKASKKRTMLSIIGIVLSVALISTIGLFFYNIQLTQIKDIKQSRGSYHLMYKEVDEDLVNKIANNPKVSKYGLYYQGEKINIDESLTVMDVKTTENAAELLPVTFSEGRFPSNENEIALEKWVLEDIDKQIKLGDKVKISEKEYSLVGIISNFVGTQEEDTGILLTKSDKLEETKSVLFVEVSSKTNMKKAVSELYKLAEEGSVEKNQRLLILQGAAEDDKTMKSLFFIISIIIGIVVISTIAVIYNAFQISVVERIKQFGLLRAIGTTPKQIRKIVLREATLLALIGIPLGLFFGFIAIILIGVVFKIIGSDSVFAMNMSLSPGVMIISGVVGVLAIYISAFIPAVFAGRISPLVAITRINSITKEKIKRRKNKLIGKIFGFEGELAAKNIKRNKKRYRITVFSIVISVVLFISFNSFIDMSLNFTETINESTNIHFSVIRTWKAGEDDFKIESKVIEELENLDYVYKVYNNYNNSFYPFEVEIDKDKKIEEVSDIEGVYKEKGDKSYVNANVTIYDDNALESAKKYIESGKIDRNKLNSENGIIVINKNRIYDKNKKRSQYGPVVNVKIGDKLILGEDGVTVTILAILEDEPFDFIGPGSGIKIITTKEVASIITRTESIEPLGFDIVLNDINDEEQAQVKIEEIMKDYLTTVKIINKIDQQRNAKTTILMLKILLYGFVIVISLIGSVNIINTLTTNIILRKSEFGALKAIGLTQKGLKKMIILEGLLYSFVGSIYGAIIGTILSYVMYKGFGAIGIFKWSIPWQGILIATGASLLIGYLSVLAPLRRIKNENLIEAIREDA